MVTAYIGLGSNLGNIRENLLQAWARLGEVKGVKLQRLSSPYRSAPVNMASSNWFINAVGVLQTSLPAEKLLAAMLAVEAGLGRKRDASGEALDRTIDLDLLYWDARISAGPGVVLPHPEIVNRLFVLLPLAEVGPQMLHPVYRKTSLEMLRELMVKQHDTGREAQVQKTAWPPEYYKVTE